MVTVQTSCRSDEIWPIMAAHAVPVLSWLWVEKRVWGPHFFCWLHSRTHKHTLHLTDRTNAEEGESAEFKSILRLNTEYPFAEWTFQRYYLFNSKSSAVPQAESNLEIMISGVFVHFAHSAFITAHGSHLLHLLKMDTFCNILLIHIVSFESLRLSEQTKKLEPHISDPQHFSLN